MKILQFNILDGCQGQPDRLNALGEWLSCQPFDVVGLNELNGWNAPPGISGLAARWGYQDSVLFETRGSPYFIGALSRHPIETIASIEEGFHHAVLILKIMGIHVVITHLSPRDATDREQEAARIAGLVEDIEGPLLLMGDLNTLSPLDRESHLETGLAGLLGRDALLRRKFLDDRGEINYRPMQTLLDAGLVDLNPDHTPTVPTASNTDRAHATPMRLDYILGNQAFLTGRHPVASVLQDSPLPHLSDHFPVMCQW